MPQQDTFLDEIIEGKRTQVLKTYDQSFAREVFESMSDAAKAFLWTAMKPEKIYEAGALPSGPGEEYDAFLLDELLDQGREDWNKFSYFVVMKTGQDQPAFVAPDWPTAEAYARSKPAPDLAPRPLTRLDTSGPQF